MSTFRNRNNEPTITITPSDIDTQEKAERFIDLFGRSHYYKVFNAFSEQRWGDGSIQSAFSEMETLDPTDPKDEKRYETLKAITKKEAAKLKERSEMSVEVPVYESTREHIFNNRGLAKEVLGPIRYEKAAGLENMAAADDKSLMKSNPHIKEQQTKSANIKEKLEQLDRRRQELLEQKPHETED